jgi:hypothetical protein
MAAGTGIEAVSGMGVGIGIGAATGANERTNTIYIHDLQLYECYEYTHFLYPRTILLPLIPPSAFSSPHTSSYG